MNDKPSFFDGKTLGAIAIVFAVWMGWQYYMQSKYPHIFNEQNKETIVENPNSTASSTEKKDSTVVPESGAPTSAADGGRPADSTSPVAERAQLGAAPSKIEAVKETVLTFESPTLSFDISSEGMGIRNLRLNKFTDRSGEIIRVGVPANDKATFATSLIGQPGNIPFELSKVDDRTFIGRAQWGDLQIVKKIEVIASKYELQTDIQVSGSNPGFIGVSTNVFEEIVPVQGGSFFVPQYERQEFYVEDDDTTHRVHIAKDNIDQSFSKATLMSVGSQYFTQAFVNRSDVLPDLKVNAVQESKTAKALLTYQKLSGSDFSVKYSSFIGPKDVELMKSVDPQLANVIDFGFFSWIAKYLLIFMKQIFEFVGNWGVAIIILTLVVRILVLPFNIMSYKSMKVMQDLQPQMKAIREKYKDDSQKMNLEIMNLMKVNKANPIGGCLPMLLQFPIFLALYQVLGHSIELYQAPFAFWIHDLSAKDPYYVLPVLMGVTLFLQQKITPNTMDPAQAKVLMFMPILFSFFMLSLPSGLTLYIFVSGIFGVLQQLYFLKFNQVKKPA